VRWINWVMRLMKRGSLSIRLNEEYADDTLLFLEHNYIAASHLKWLLMCLEKLLGMNINYHKSDVTPLTLLRRKARITYSRIFCCNLGEFPFKYLGVPLHYDKLRKEDIQPLVDKIRKGIVGWKGRLLSYRAKLALPRACLASIPIYLMSVIKFPKWFRDTTMLRVRCGDI
jgi:hypothetical protein